MTFISGGEPPIIEVTPEAPSMINVVFDPLELLELEFVAPPTLHIVPPDVPDITIIGLAGPPGPEGPPGPQGPPGEAGVGAYYRFIQATAATVWDITHTIPYRPAVTVVDSAGEIIVPDIQFISDVQIRLVFSAEVAGEAYLS